MMSLILFEQDWLKYPTARPDFSTKNKSAIKLAQKLRLMGIKNHLFFLALFDQGLVGIDPHDEHLSQEMMERVGIECARNPWYFFREVARAPALSGTESKRVEFNRSNVCLWWCFFNHITIILTQPRQTGKSFNSDLLMTGLQNFWTQNTQINLLTATDKLRVENVERLKKIYDSLPEYLNFKTRHDSNNTELLTVNAYGNRYVTHVAQSSEKNAHKLGRGLTTSIIQIDEGPFISHIETTTKAAFGAMGAAITAAKENKSPYGIVWTTTSGNQDDRDGAFAYKYVCNSALWNERFYDALDEITLRRMVIAHNPYGKDYRIYAAFNHRQLGKNDEWMLGELLRTGSTGDKADADFFNIWPSGSASSPIDLEILRRIKDHISPELHTSVSPVAGYLVRWYIPEDQIESYMANNPTVAGIDTSDGVGKDALSFVLTDAKTGALVASSTVYTDNLVTYGSWVVWWLKTYPNTTLIPERRNQATAIIDHIIMELIAAEIDPFRRIFNWVVNSPMEYAQLWQEVQEPMRRRDMSLYVRAKQLFGFATSGSGRSSRNEIYSTVLMSATRRFGHLIKDSVTAHQILALTVINNRIDHPRGGHDDMVIAWLMGHWLLSRGQNLKYYGINSFEVLQDEQTIARQSRPQTYQDARQAQIRARIEELVALMSQNLDAFVISRYEQEMRHLDRQLILQENEFFSIDQVLENIQKQKKKGRQENTDNTPYVANDVNRMGYYDSRNAPGDKVYVF